MNYQVMKKGYPNQCKIYHYTQPATAKSPQFNKNEREMVVLYEGPCVKYGSSQMRKFTNGNVVKADYAVDFPTVVHGIHPGYLIDVEDGISKYERVEVVTSYPDDVFGLGTTVFFNITMN